MLNDTTLAAGRTGPIVATQSSPRPNRWRAALAAVGAGFMALLREERSRRALLSLSDHQLRDVGLTRADAGRKDWKSFWQP